MGIQDVRAHPTGAAVADGSGGREEEDEARRAGVPVEGVAELGGVTQVDKRRDWPWVGKTVGDFRRVAAVMASDEEGHGRYEDDQQSAEAGDRDLDTAHACDDKPWTSVRRQPPVANPGWTPMNATAPMPKAVTVLPGTVGIPCNGLPLPGFLIGLGLAVASTAIGGLTRWGAPPTVGELSGRSTQELRGRCAVTGARNDLYEVRT
jgi:hypothetical protein